MSSTILKSRFWFRHLFVNIPRKQNLLVSDYFVSCWSEDSIHVFDFCLIHQPSLEYSSWKSTGQHLRHCFTKGNIGFRHPRGQAVYQPNCRLVLVCFLPVPTLPKFDSEGLRKGGSTSTCVILHSICASKSVWMLIKYDGMTHENNE